MSLETRRNSIGFRNKSSERRAFTLVELLVVIGIIALLIAILLPSLANARRTAQRVACAAKLQQIMVAAQAHVTNHKGYYPIAGLVGDITPAGLGDPNMAYYDYFQYTPFSLNNALAPITLALSKEMSYKGIYAVTDNTVLAQIESDPNGFLRNFWCPSQGSSPQDFPNQGALFEGSFNGTGQLWAIEGQSYIFNEGVLGFDDALGRLRGKASMVRQSSKTMFAADGNPGGTGSRNSSYPASKAGEPCSTVYNNFASGAVTASDVLRGLQIAGYVYAGDVQNFDKLRHRGKINIAFCDGHVETRNISTQDLVSVFLIAP